MTESEFRAKLAAEGYEVKEVTWSPASVRDDHSHDFDAYGLVLTGGFTLTCEGKACAYGPGDTFSLAAGIPHSEHVAAEGATLVVGRRG